MMKHTSRMRVTAVLLTALLGCTSLAGCGAKTDSTPQETQTTPATQEETTETQTETDAVTEEPTTEHISPMETVVSTLGTQIDVSAVLDRDSNDDAAKNYKAALSQFIEEGDMIHSFTFVFYAADGKSDIGTFKGGCGISVNADCAAATDAGWFQSEDFEAQSQGSYIEVRWDVPDNVAPYITEGGEVQIGYWWGSTQKVELKQIICNYTRTAELPVDSTQTISVGKTLNFDSDETNTIKVPLSEVLGEDGVPQAITFDISASGAFRKFTGAFGITTDDWYQSETVAILTDSSSLSLTWILPEDVKYSVPQNSEVMLGYWWGETNDITLQSVTIKYSVGGTRPAASQPIKENVTAADNQSTAAQIQGDGRAAAIVADIKVGWNLGNTLDSYDKNNKKVDYETYWGNPKTTQAMFDAVKAKGFNAVRIPVSWTNHLSDDNTIDAAWLDRVQEVVDYAMADDLYVILNMHHDDYTWLHPVYAEEEAVSAKYVRIWEQIADRFKDYDTNLMFEGMNEPRMVGSANEWMGGTDEERTVINHLLAKFVRTVRDSGGKNGERTLIMTTHAASIEDAALNGLELPDDNNLIVSIHSYAPWKFTTKEYPNDKTFDASGESELDAKFDKLYEKFVSKGIPVIIGEFGAEDKDNDSDRDAYYSYYIQAAAKRGIPCFIWDNGPADSYGAFDRKNGTWFDNGIGDAIAGAIQ